MIGEFVEAHRDATVAFDTLEKVLYAMPLFVQQFVQHAGLFAVTTRRDDHDTTLALGLFDYAVGVISAIGDEIGIAYPSEQLPCLRHVMNLPLGEVEMNRIALGVDTRMNFRGRSASGLPD